MKLHTLTPSKGSLGREKRIGRGEGSGHGGTSTRGHKGAHVRDTLARKDLWVVRCLFRGVCLNTDSRIRIELNTKR